MFDHRLKVFTAVAKRLSFTKAADEVNISQPAVSKHIRELENDLKTKLFSRNGNKIALTASGKILLQYSEKIRSINRDFEFELNQLNSIKKSKLKIGASTTIANYILPEILTKFNSYYPNIEIEVLVNNSEKISQLLEKNKIDCGLTEGKTQSNLLDYTPFLKDEIVLVTHNQNQLPKIRIKLDDLHRFYYVTRENGSGSQEVIKDTLKKSGVNYDDFHTIVRLGSSESIKNYILHSDTFAFLSISTVYQELKNKSLKVIDIENFTIPREFYFMTQKGNQSPVVDLLKTSIFNN